MFKNKKILLVLIFSLVLSGCGVNGNAPTQPPTVSPTPTIVPSPTSSILPLPTPTPTPTPSIVPSPTPTPTQSTTAEPTSAEQTLTTMSMEEKIGQLFIYGFQEEGVEFTEGMARIMAQFKPAGVVLFSNAIGTRTQVIAMTEALKAHSMLPLFVAVDEEGGQVSRVGSLYEEKIGPAGETRSVEEAAERGAAIGRQLFELGFNLNFAPVADVDSNPQNTVIGERAFSSDPDTAAAYVSAFIQGSHRENILTAIKHFPGHGDTDEDSHLDTAIFKYDRQRLDDIELKPFIAGIAAGTDAVMVGHISTPEITGDNVPATLSHALITGLLRGELGFDGLVITDAMNMGAITNNYTAGEAAVAAINAGADLILMPEDMAEAVHAVTAAYENGEITEERIDASVLRVLKAKLGQ